MALIKKILICALSTVMLTSITAFSVYAFADDGDAGDEQPIPEMNYYQSQLIGEGETYYDSVAMAVYRGLEEMLEEDKLMRGTESIDLVERGFLENREYDYNELKAGFIIGRDAFSLDHPEVFYVDFNKMNISATNKHGKYYVQIGIGGESTYYADGFTYSKSSTENRNVIKAIQAFDRIVTNLVDLANGYDLLFDKVYSVYAEIIKKSTYYREKQALTENVDYVINAYGVLINCKATCEGYAKAVKILLDKLGIENVIARGTYVGWEHHEEGHPHFWNYVKMDDGRWYLLDVTRADTEVNDASQKRYFLKNSYDKEKLETVRDNETAFYQPNGIISVSSKAFEFTYPSISLEPYEGAEIQTEKINGKVSVSVKDNDYNVTIKYLEKLIKADEGADIGATVTCKTFSAGRLVKNFSVIDDGYGVTFTFNPEVDYEYTAYYYIDLVNLVGEKSGLTLRQECVTVINGAKLRCPVVYDDISTAQVNSPTIVGESGFLVDEWLGDDGELIGEDLPPRLTLIAGELDELKLNEMIEKVKTEFGENVLGGYAYNLRLELCGERVSEVVGKRVKILMPLPDGYDKGEDGVTVKVYRFNDDDTLDLLDCVVNEFSTMVACDGFSSYLVVATAQESTDKSVLTAVFGEGGTITYLEEKADGTAERKDCEFITVSEGESKSVAVSAKKGYEIYLIKLNGEEVRLENGELLIDYDTLNDKGNVIEVSFVKSSYARPPAGGIYNDNPEGNKTLVIVASIVLIVAISGLSLFAYLKVRKNK